MSQTKFARREFLRRSVIATSALPLVGTGLRTASAASPTKPRVVHAHHGRAVTWSRAKGFYRDAIDLDAVQRMLDLAVQQLKGGNVDDAWRRVFALPSPATRKLAIKVSCNNSYIPDGCGNETDGVPEPAIATIRGFLRAGGKPSNVTVYDATTSNGARVIPDWFRQRILAQFPEVRFVDRSTPKNGLYDARTHVTWSPGYIVPPPATRISDVVLQADYLVNIPLVRRHIGAGFSLGIKNHFGSIENVHLLHPYVWDEYNAGSVLADILASPNVPGDPTVKSFRRKTVLTIGDMLLGQPCKNYGYTPVAWQTFGNEWPNSLIVGDDPVATDSVMLDLLEPEPGLGDCGGIAPWARRHLQVAESRGLGVYEHLGLPSLTRFDPRLMTYTKIDYRFQELLRGGADLQVRSLADDSAALKWSHYFDGPCSVYRATRPDFSDAQLLTTTTAGEFIDGAHLPKAFYRVEYVGT